jgi:hypothetical protein
MVFDFGAKLEADLSVHEVGQMGCYFPARDHGFIPFISRMVSVKRG